MVFTSIPAAYLEAANWQQQQQPNHLHGNTNSTSQQLLQPPLPPPPPPPVQLHGAGGGAGSIRPGSMADKARMANLPMPETALRCPRCESTNTKFCYFNNYSLSQPRHFCKTCRRYWTRGGALRNVPVGGGCRRNKRSKGTGTSSKSPAASSDRPTGSASSTNSASSGSVSDIVGLSPNMPPLRFMAPLLHHHQLSDFASGGDMSLNYGLNNNYGTISGPMGGGGIGDMSFQIGNSLNSSLLLSGASSLDQWRVPQQTQQFPFLAGLEGSSSSQANNSGGLYPFEGSAEISGYVRPKVSTSGMLTQFASVKMEDSNRELNLSAQFLGSNNNNVNVSTNEHNQYWNVAGGGGGGGGGGSSASAWNDFSGFSSSSTTSNQL